MAWNLQMLGAGGRSGYRVATLNALPCANDIHCPPSHVCRDQSFDVGHKLCLLPPRAPVAPPASPPVACPLAAPVATPVSTVLEPSSSTSAAPSPCVGPPPVPWSGSLS